MRKFSRRTKVNATLEQVAGFHFDIRALKRLTPPPVFIQIHDAEPLAENSKVEFTMWIGFLPVRWVAEHSNIDALRGFTDTQLHGPFSYWVHRHAFNPISESVTEIEDEVTADVGFHPFWGLVSRFMWWNLPILFAYRHWATRNALEKVDR